MANGLNRRTFLQTTAAGAAGLAFGRTLRAASVDKNSKLRLAAIGTGGKGQDDLKQISASPRVEVVALCNVDDSQPHLGWAVEAFPKAETFRDWRKLLDQANTFDAVSVSTPDFMHAPISLAAMALGKHVFCQKPLAHTVHEIRLMEESAKKHNLVTQMGNQIQAHHAYRNGVQLIQDGAIGKVREVHSWQAGNMRWLLTDKMPTTADPVPESLKWDLWLGVAAERPYKKDLYHPQNWRGWQDFGSGQLGDFGCHIFDPVFMALELTAPTTIEADAPQPSKFTWSPRSKVVYQFPGTSRTAGETINVTWYDGEGHKPKGAKLGIPAEHELPHAGSIFVGEEGSMLLPHWDDPLLFPEDKFADYKMPKLEDLNHYTAWAHACLGDGKTKSNFNYASPLAQAALLGTIAILFPKEQLLWDSGAGQFTHHADANARLTRHYRKGWELPSV